MSASKFTQIWVKPRHCQKRTAWCCETFSRICRAQFPAATAHYVASLSGQPLRTAEKHLRGEAKPGADAMLAYLNAPLIGPALCAALLRPQGEVLHERAAGPSEPGPSGPVAAARR